MHLSPNKAWDTIFFSLLVLLKYIDLRDELVLLIFVSFFSSIISFVPLSLSYLLFFAISFVIVGLFILFFPFTEAGLTALTHLRYRSPLSTKNAIAAYIPQGLCFSYINKQNRKAIMAPCKA